MIPSASESARLAVYCYGAETVGPVDMPPVASQNGPEAAQPMGGPPLPAWMGTRLSLVGWVTGRDALLEGLLNLDSRRVFYGWLCREQDGKAVLIIRGTQSFAEWAIDGEFLPMSVHPIEGDVETGFWSLFSTLEFRDLKGADHSLCIGVAHALEPGETVTVTGHSLGAALATYACAALAANDVPVRGRFIASPRPGDREFRDYFGRTVPDGWAYARSNDLVPTVPRGFGYSPIPNLVTLPIDPEIPDNLADNHHALSYAWTLDPSSLDLLPDGIKSVPWILAA